MADGTRGGSADATLDLIATDDLTSGTFSGQKAQIVKLGLGADGAMEAVSAANPLPVTTVITGTIVLPTGAATEATLLAASAKLPATLGQKAMAASLAVTVASDQSAIPVSGTFWQATQPVSGTVAATQSGTWTVQPGNTANTTAWKVDGSAVTQPVSGTVTANAGTGTFTISGAVTNTVLSVVGGGTEATAQRVTLASNSTGVIGVTGTFWQATQPVSNAGTFAVQAAQSGTWNVTNVSGTVSLPTGASTLAEQQSQTTSLQLIDDVVHASDAALSKVAAIGAQFDDVSPGTTTENNIRPVRMSTRRELYVQVRDAAGNERGLNVDAAGSVGVTGTFWQATQPVSGTVTANAGTGTFTVSGTVTANAGTNLNTSLLALESGGNLATIAGAVRAEDVASADAHTGIGALAVRKASPANTSGTDGDYEFLQISAGRLWASATIDAALPAGANAIGKLAANTGVTIGAVEIAAAQTLATVTTVGTVSAVTAISNALPAGANAIGKLAANSGVDIGDVDVTTVGTITPGTAATSLGKAVDNAAGATDTGVLGLLVRDDALTTLTPADGDYTQGRTDSVGATWVHLTDNMVPGTGSANLGKAVDNVAGATDVGVLMLGIRDDALSTLTPVDGDYTSPRFDSTGAMWVNAGTGPAQYAEDAAHSSGDLGAPVWAVREDTPTSTAGTTGDYTAFTVDSNGRQWVNGGTTVMANSQVAPTTSAATLIAARTGRQKLIMRNIGGVTVYVGIATVTTANGFPIDIGASLTLETSALVQAITSSGTGNVAIIELYT